MDRQDGDDSLYFDDKPAIDDDVRTIRVPDLPAAVHESETRLTFDVMSGVPKGVGVQPHIRFLQQPWSVVPVNRYRETNRSA